MRGPEDRLESELADMDQTPGGLIGVAHSPIARDHLQAFSECEGNEETIARGFVVREGQFDGWLDQLEGRHESHWNLAERPPKGQGVLVGNEFLLLRVPEGVRELDLDAVGCQQTGVTPEGLVQDGACPIREFLFGIPLDGYGRVENNPQESGSRSALFSNGRAGVHNSVLATDPFADAGECSENALGSCLGRGLVLSTRHREAVEIGLKCGELIGCKGLDFFDDFSFAHGSFLNIRMVLRRGCGRVSRRQRRYHSGVGCGGAQPGRLGPRKEHAARRSDCR